jgi:hypothetical protein
MPFGMGSVGWAYVRPYAYSYTALPCLTWPWWYGWKMGWGRGFGWRRFRSYQYYPWW